MAIGLSRTIRADTFHHILGLLWLEAIGNGDLWNPDSCEAERAVAQTARQVYMALAMARVVYVADAIFLRARTIVDVMKQMGIGQ